MNLTRSQPTLSYKIIPINRGAAYQRFRVQLGNHMLIFRLRWLTRFGYFCVDIHEGDTPVTLGRALHPGVNLLAGINTTIGVIVLDGDSPKIDTLGVTSRLIWYPNDE